MEEEKQAGALTAFEEDDVFRKFRRALRRSDQVALDDLVKEAKQHTAAMALEKYATTFEMLLLALLLEEHKEVVRLRAKLEEMV